MLSSVLSAGVVLLIVALTHALPHADRKRAVETYTDGYYDPEALRQLLAQIAKLREKVPAGQGAGRWGRSIDSDREDALKKLLEKWRKLNEKAGEGHELPGGRWGRKSRSVDPSQQEELEKLLELWRKLNAQSGDGTQLPAGRWGRSLHRHRRALEMVDRIALQELAAKYLKNREQSGSRLALARDRWGFYSIAGDNQQPESLN